MTGDDRSGSPGEQPLPGDQPAAEQLTFGPPVGAATVPWPDDHDRVVAPVGVVEDVSDEPDDVRGGPAEWAWVQEWRASGERAPWPQGVALAAFTLIIVASAIFVLTAGVADTPWLAVVLNVVVAAGVGPQLWLARGIPVIRFVSWGAALGVPVGWLACFVVPFPT